MSTFGRMYRGETEFDFIAQRKRWFTVSAVLIAVSLLSLLIRGLDLSIDFTGGTLVDAPNESGLDVADYRDALADIGQEGARVQLTGEATRVLISTGELDAAERLRAIESQDVATQSKLLAVKLQVH